MKRIISLVLVLLFSVSSLQLCKATEIDGGKVDHSITSNAANPIIIQVPSAANHSKDEKYKDFLKDILSIVKWLTIFGSVAFLYNKYHEPVEEFVGKTTENVEKFTSGAASLTKNVTESGGEIARVAADRLDSVITATGCVAVGAVLSYFITAVAGLITAIASCLPKAPVAGK